MHYFRYSVKALNDLVSDAMLATAKKESGNKKLVER